MIVRLRLTLRAFCVGIFWLLSASSAYAANSYVPDETTAIAIAKAVLRPLVGRDLIDGPKALPFYASLEAPPYSNIWYVENAPPTRAQWATPIIRVEMDKESGRILKVDDPVFVYDPPPFHVRENVWVIMDTPQEKKKWTPHAPPCVQKKSPSGTLYSECNDIIAQDISATGFVPDEQTAIEIAKAVLHVHTDRPFHAHLIKDQGIWVAEVSLGEKKGYSDVFRVKLDKKSGFVIDKRNE